MHPRHTPTCPALGCLVAVIAITVATGGAQPVRDPLADAARTLTTAGATTLRLEWAGRMVSRAPADRAIEIARAAIERGGWEARRQVARALAAVADPRAAVSLVKLSDDLAWSVRSAAVRSLGLRGDPETLEVAVRLLADPVWSVRWQAARALAAVPADGEIGARRNAALLEAARDDQAAVRAEAERALLAQPIPAATALYTAIFRRASDEPARRLAAVRALARVGDESVDAMFRAIADDRAPTAPILAMRALQLRGDDPLADNGRERVRALLLAWTRESGAPRAAAEATVWNLPADAVSNVVAVLRSEAELGRGGWNDIAEWIVASTLELGASPMGLVDDSSLPAALRPALLEAVARQRPKPFVADATDLYLRARGSIDRRDSTADLRAGCISVIRFGATPATGSRVLERAIDDPSPVVRTRAAHAWLRVITGDRPYDPLGRRLAKNRSGHYGSTFLNRVARRRTPVALNFLIRVAEGKFTDRAKIRLSALNALTSTEWSGESAARVTDWLRRQLAREPDPDGRVRILRLLYNLDRDDALPTLAKVALDPAERLEVRIAAVKKLGYSKRDSAAPALRKLLNASDTPRDLRDVARLHLLQLAQPEDLGEMIAALESGPPRLRRFALAALERVRAPAALPAVRKTAANGLVATESRAQALRVIAATEGDPSADTMLKHLREERVAEMRVAALDALGLLSARSYTGRLLNYVRVLESGRHHETRSRELFAEIIGELGRAPASAVTDFLIAFMLTDEMAPDHPPAEERPPRPLAVAARMSLFGHGPLQVQRRLNAVIAAQIDSGAGCGIPERFYSDFLDQCRRPARRKSWSSLAVDLAGEVLASAPHGSQRDAAAHQLIATTAFDAAEWKRAAEHFERMHRLMLQEGHFPPSASPEALESDPLHRLHVQAVVARAMASGEHDDDADASAAAIRRAIDAWPHDGAATVLAVQAMATLELDIDWAVERLSELGRRGRGPDGALARYALARSLAPRGRKDDAIALLGAALRDHPRLAARIRSDAALTSSLDAATITRLIQENQR